VLTQDFLVTVCASILYGYNLHRARMALEELRKRLKTSIDDALEGPSSSQATPSSSTPPSTPASSSTVLEPIPNDLPSSITLEVCPSDSSVTLEPVESQPQRDTPLEEVVNISTPDEQPAKKERPPPEKSSRQDRYSPQRSVTLHDPLFDAALHFQAADYSLKEGRFKKANASYDRAFQLLRGQHIKKKEYRTLNDYADDYVTSLQLAGEPDSAARFARSYGKFLLTRKQYAQAEMFFEEAVTIIEKHELPTDGKEYLSLANVKHIIATNLEQKARALQDHDET